MNFTTPTWQQIGELQGQLDEVHQENALKLKQILDLEDILWSVHPFEMDDGSPCYCGAYVWKPTDTNGNIVHAPKCERAREATKHLWSKPHGKK